MQASRHRRPDGMSPMASLQVGLIVFAVLLGIVGEEVAVQARIKS